MAKMTKQEAIRILMHLDTYVEHDEEFGIMVKAPLMDACVMAIKSLKADAVEVVHGRWLAVEEGLFHGTREKCSLCGLQKNRGLVYHYCPNCGAKMDGDVNG